MGSEREREKREKREGERERSERSKEMGVLLKIVDLVLFVFFLFIAIAAPAIDLQALVSEGVFPSVLVELKHQYSRDFGDYLVAEKPHFYVGLVWLELLFLWPLSLLSLYAIITSKPWLNTTCLIYGSSVLTSMFAILSEMIGSGKASEKLLNMHYPFLGFAVLAMLRGLLSQTGKSASTGAGKGTPAISRKKRA